MDSAKSATAPEEAAHAITMVMLRFAYAKIMLVIDHLVAITVVVLWLAYAIIMFVIDHLVAIPPRALAQINDLTPWITRSMPGYVALGPLALFIVAKGLVFILSALAYDLLPPHLFRRVLDGILRALIQSSPVESSAPIQAADNSSSGMMLAVLVFANHIYYHHICSGAGGFNSYRRQLQIWTAVLISAGFIRACVEAVAALV
ncbi:hypothetical protein LTR37_003897 [Vermiconidia calcicola]|uniref:Uncharacterized protein n=1 Tax=Vermiconidia calcicola TaxID=1690605 RepID=A0ACC3NNN4_9PEZI|nr:hypothetical protein LTR37_003897 [Vermiconidia calcicola]